MKFLNKAVIILFLYPLFIYSSINGNLDINLSEGNINLNLSINELIQVNNLQDINFDNINSINLSDSYVDTKSISFCVYTNAPFFRLTIDPLNDSLIHESYTSPDGNSAKDNIPVYYNLYRNEISNGSISSTTLLNANFTTSTVTASQTINVDIMNLNCLSSISNSIINNYVLETIINGEDIIKAAAGIYNEVVYIRATTGINI